MYWKLVFVYFFRVKFWFCARVNFMTFRKSVLGKGWGAVSCILDFQSEFLSSRMDHMDIVIAAVQCPLILVSERGAYLLGWAGWTGWWLLCLVFS